MCTIDTKLAYLRQKDDLKLRRPLVPLRATVEEVNNASQKELDASGKNFGISYNLGEFEKTKDSCKEVRRSKSNP